MWRDENTYALTRQRLRTRMLGIVSIANLIRSSVNLEALQIDADVRSVTMEDFARRSEVVALLLTQHLSGPLERIYAVVRWTCLFPS